MSEETSDMPAFSPASVSRLTVVETMYFQPHGEDAVSLGKPFSRQLKGEEHWQRTIRVGPEWVEIKGCWLEKASVIRVANDEGKTVQVIPTPEQKAVSAAKIMEVGIVAVESATATMHDPPNEPIGFALVAPGEDCRFEPTAWERLRFRCLKGEVRITVSILPT